MRLEVVKVGRGTRGLSHSVGYRTLPNAGFRVSVCIKNFAKHCYFKVEPARVDHPDGVFCKMWGVGLESS